MPNPNPDSLDLACQAICFTLVPFVLAAAGGDAAKANAVITDMIMAYEPANLIELDLAGRIVGFNLAAMDSIRRSIADPDMPDAKVLRYRSNAASLSRSAEQCRAALASMRAASNPEPAGAALKPGAKSPRPSTKSAVAASDASLEKAKARAPIILSQIAHSRREWESGPQFPGLAIPSIAGAAPDAEPEDPANARPAAWIEPNPVSPLAQGPGPN